MTPSSSLETILTDHGPFLHRLARALVSDTHLAEDLVQDTWSIAITSPRSPTEDTEGGKTRAWLSTVLRQLAYSHYRKADVRRHSELPADHPGAAEGTHDVTERLERDRLVHEALTAMDEPYRSVLVMRYHDGCRTSEIAEKMGVKESSMRTQLSRGVERLRVALDRAYGDAADPRSAWLAAFAPLLKSAPIVGASSPMVPPSAGGRLVGFHGPFVALASVALLAVAVVALMVHRDISLGEPDNLAGGIDAGSLEAPQVPVVGAAAQRAEGKSAQGDTDFTGGPGLLEPTAPAERTSATQGPGRSSTAERSPAPLSVTSFIQGSVRLADGTPVPDRLIQGYPVSAMEDARAATEATPRRRESPVETRTAADGTFRLPNLPPGTYDLLVDTSLEVSSASLGAVPTGTVDADLVLDAVLVHASFPTALHSHTKGRELDVHPRPTGTEEVRGISIRNFQLDAGGSLTLLLPQGPGYSLVYESPSHEKHGTTLAPELPSGAYRRQLADSDPSLGAIHVVVRGEAIPESSRVYVGLAPVVDRGFGAASIAGSIAEHVIVRAPARSARNGLVEPGRYRVQASLRQQLLEGWLIATPSAEHLTLDAGGAATLEILLEPAGALTLHVESTPGSVASPATHGTLRAETLDTVSGEWRPLAMSQITGNAKSGPVQSSTGGPILPGVPRYNREPLPVGQLTVRLIGDGWRTHQETLEIRARERTPWTVRLERTD